MCVVHISLQPACIFMFLHHNYENILTFWSHRDPVLTACQLMACSSAANKSTHSDTLLIDS